MESPIILQTNRLKLYYGAFEALKGIDMQIPEKQITAFIGPSGCGKSTILRTLGGFLDIDKGDILIDGESVKDLPPEKRPEIIHQCGMKAVEEVKASYAALGIEAQVIPFIEDMAAAYVWADVVLARAGAISVSELTAAGVPSILVPLVTKTTSHQVGNAKYMQEAGAAIYLPQSELTTGKLTALLEGLNRKELLEMAKKAKALGKPDAAATVADFIEYVSNKE